MEIFKKINFISCFMLKSLVVYEQLVNNKIIFLLPEREANAHITMGKKRHFSDGNTRQSEKTKHVVKTKQLNKVLKKMTQKATDAVKQAPAKVKQQKKDDKAALKPKVTVVTKPVIKVKEAQSKDVSEEKKDDSNDDDEDDDDDETDDNINNDEVSVRANN